MKQDYHQAHYGLTSGSSLATEKIMFLYKPVPEVVACKALELIQQNDGMETMTVDDIQYHIFVFGADSQSVIPESGPVHMEIRAGQSPRLQSPSSGTIHMPSTVVELGHDITNWWDSPYGPRATGEFNPPELMNNQQRRELDFSLEENSNIGNIDVSWI